MQPSKWKSFPQIGRKCSSETNIFAPENGWLEYYPFLLGFGLFSGAMLVSGSVAIVSLSLSLCVCGPSLKLLQRGMPERDFHSREPHHPTGPVK